MEEEEERKEQMRGGEERRSGVDEALQQREILINLSALNLTCSTSLFSSGYIKTRTHTHTHTHAVVQL